MADPMDRSQEELLSNRSFLFWFQKFLKEAAFNFSALVIGTGDEIFSYPFRVFFTIVETMQIFQLVFKPQIRSLWKADDSAQVMYQIFSLASLVDYLISATLSVYIFIFYLLLIVLAVILVYMLYVQYTISRKLSVSFKFLSVFSKAFNELLIPVLVLPFINYFLSIFDCQDKGGEKLHFAFNSMVCFSGSHIIYTFFAVFGIIWFIILSITLSLTAYEIRVNNNHYLAKCSGRGDFAILMYKTSLSIGFFFLKDSDYEIILAFLFSFGSIFLYLYFNKNIFYYDTRMRSLQITQLLINSWGGLVLIFAAFSRTIFFNGYILSWIAGSFLLTIIAFMRKDERIKLLLDDPTKAETESYAHTQMMYIIFILKYFHNQTYAIVFKGFLESHKISCSRSDCPVRKSYVDSKKMKRLYEEDSDGDFWLKTIFLIDQNFTLILERFPNSISVRVSYALFLWEKMKQKQSALQQLVFIESRNPSFDDSFTIFRLKKLIEDEMMNNLKSSNKQRMFEGDRENLNELAYQDQVKNLRSLIEKSSNMHVEFWSDLSEEVPDLAKILEVGKKICLLNVILENCWKKLNETSAGDIPSLMRIYSRYKFHILNDKYGAEEILNNLKVISRESKKTFNIGDIGNDSSPILFVSGESDKLGWITALNSSAASVFNYSKNELLNRKINLLMPTMVSQFHDNFMDRYLYSLEPRIIGKDFFVMAKSKTNYLIPITMNVNFVPSVLQGLQFVCLIKQEKYLSCRAYMLINPSGQIENISAACLSLLGLSLKEMEGKNHNILNFIHNFWDEQKDFMTKIGRLVSVNVRKKYAKHMKMQATAEEITFPSQGLQGYLIKLERHIDPNKGSKIDKAPNTTRAEPAVEKLAANPKTERLLRDDNVFIPNIDENTVNKRLFMFQYDQGNKLFRGEFKDLGREGNQYSMLMGNSFLEQQENFNVQISEVSESGRGNSTVLQEQKSKLLMKLEENMLITKKKEEEEKRYLEMEKFDYAGNIKVARLWKNNVVMDLDVFKNDSEEEEPNEEEEHLKTSKNKEIKKYEKESGVDSGVASVAEDELAFKNRENLLGYMLKHKSSKSKGVLYLHITSLVLLLIMAIIFIAEFFSIISIFDKINSSYHLIQEASLRLTYSQQILFYANELRLLNYNITSSDQEAGLRVDLENSIKNLEIISKSLTSSSMELTEEHQRLYSEKVVPVSYLESDNTTSVGKFAISEVVEQIISKAFSIRNSPTKSIKQSNTDFFFINHNLFNDFYMNLEKSNNFYYDQLILNVTGKQSSITIFLVVSVLTLALSFLVFIPMFKKMNLEEFLFVKMFLNIPKEDIKGLLKKCEIYVNELQLGEEMIDEQQGNTQGDENEKNEKEEYVQKRSSRRKFKYESQKLNYFLIQFFLCCALIELFFLLSYLINMSYSNEVQRLAEEFKACTRIDPTFINLNNAFRQISIDRKETIGGIKGEEYFFGKIGDLQRFLNDYISAHYANDDILQTNYNDAVASLYLQDGCVVMENLKLIARDTCLKDTQSKIPDGLKLTLTNIADSLISLGTLWSQWATDPNIQTKLNSTGEAKLYVYPDPVDNQLLNILNLFLAKDINRILKSYVFPLQNYLTEKFLKDIDTRFADEKSTKITIFLVFILALILLYLFFWLPIFSRYNIEISRTKAMIAMIPINIIENNKEIKNKLQKFFIKE